MGLLPVVTAEEGSCIYWYPKGLCPFELMVNVWRKSCILRGGSEKATVCQTERFSKKTAMTNLNEIKITPRDRQVLRLLVQGCSNKEIAAQLDISPRTVKQHLRTLFLRAVIKDGRKRVRLATAMFQKEQMESCHQGTD